MANASELFKGAEDVTRFLKSLEGLLALKDVLADAGTIIQSVEEAEKARAAAQSDAILAKTEADAAREEADKQRAAGKQAYEDAISDAAGAIRKAQDEAKEIVERAEAEALRKIEAADARVASIIDQQGLEATKLASIEKDIEAKALLLAELEGRIDEIKAKLGA